MEEEHRGSQGREPHEH